MPLLAIADWILFHMVVVILTLLALAVAAIAAAAMPKVKLQRPDSS
jgi:hypothetical protein